MQLIARGPVYTAHYDHNARRGDHPYVIYRTGGEGVCRVGDANFARDIAEGRAVMGEDGRFDYPEEGQPR